jgi:plasmid stability protein
MAELTLSGIDDSLVAYLKASAEATGRTVEQVAIRAVEDGLRFGRGRACPTAELTLANVDDRLVACLKASAEATGRTIERVAIKAIENGVKLDREGRLALADKARAMQPKPLTDDSTDIIRRLRDGS